MEISELGEIASLADLLPLARALSAQAMSIALAREALDGRAPSCRAGCAACCRQLVPISVIEAQALDRAVEALPEAARGAVEARFRAAVKRLEQIGLLAPGAPGRMTLKSPVADARAAWSEVVRRYFSAKIPCPLLDPESLRCLVYEERPMVCREHLVTTPEERCEALDEGVRAVPRGLRGSEVLATAAREISGEAWPMLPLPLALEWCAAAGASLELASEGENLLNHLIAAADEVAGAP